MNGFFLKNSQYLRVALRNDPYGLVKMSCNIDRLSVFEPDDGTAD